MTPVGGQNPFTLCSLQKMGIATPQHPVAFDVPQENDLVLEVEDSCIVLLGTSLRRLADHLATGSAASAGDDMYSESDPT